MTLGMCVLATCGTSGETPFAEVDVGADAEQHAALIGGDAAGEAYSAVQFLLGYDARLEPAEPQNITQCTAVRIRPDVVLFSAQCLEQGFAAGNTDFVLNSQSAPMAGTGFVASSRIDSTVVLKTQHVDAASGTKQSVELAIGFLAAPDWEHDVAQLPIADGLEARDGQTELYAIGFGADAQGWRKSSGVGVKRRASMQVDACMDDALLISGEHPVCLGDAGAPLFSEAAPNVVLALASAGTKSYWGYCRTPSRWTRLQTYRPWIEAQLAAACASGVRHQSVCDAYP